MDDPNSINMASILDDPEGFYEKYSKNIDCKLQYLMGGHVPPVAWSIVRLEQSASIAMQFRMEHP